MNKLILILFLAFSCVTVSAQNKIRGRIVDGDGMPLPGVKVSAKGGTESVLSDFDGTYQIVLDENIHKLIIEYGGYNTRIVKIADAVNVVLEKTNFWTDTRGSGWMISFQMAFPEMKNMQPSYGAMVGWCRKMGGYIKGVWRQGEETHSALPDIDNVWTTGKWESAFRAITGGTIIRLNSPFHVYAGAGFTSRRITYEVAGVGNCLYNQECCNGDFKFGLDAGVMFKIRYFLLTTGVMWTPARSGIVGNFGIGVSF